MADFEFDSPPSPGTNRSAPITDCPTCDGDRFVPVTDDEHGAYMRCSECNPGTERAATNVEAWWKE